MEHTWQGIWVNKVFWITNLSWLTAQGLKVIIGLVTEKKFNFNWILRTGGMPSAHSAAVVGLASSLGKEVGFFSPLFAMSCFFALMTMFDAQTWRRSIGVQARILNRIMDDLHSKRKIQDDRLKELAGHTPIEVFAGALIGILVTLIFYK
ncbi:MAG: divergent PAP2 family protein [Candidatus Omnitrophica bacterium]|nr:divergent PAP2 family protein [Candidatus Omnitrophota bacterium]